MDWPADSVERRPLAALFPYAKNSRTHSDAQVEQIAASIREWGWTMPVLIDEAGQIIAGAGRVLAAQKLGLAEVPVMIARGWGEAQKRAYVIADNKLAENAGWDIALLKMELADLKLDGFELGLTGFEPGEIAALFDPRDQRGDPDEAPEPPANPVTRPGDLWLLGAHRVVCGDATGERYVSRLLDGAKPLLMVTDPPYGVNYDADWRNRADRANGKAIGARAVGKVSNDDRVDWRAAWALFPGDVVYCWHAGHFAGVVQDSLEAVHFDIRAQIIWAKNIAVIGRGHYHFQHEPCWYAVRKGASGHWVGDRKQTSLWQIDKNMKSETGHSTQKPVECMRRPILNNSTFGAIVYDPFLGSGTTLIAAELEGRVCYGLEIEPAYVDVIVQRWENYTGHKARRAGNENAEAHAPALV